MGEGDASVQARDRASSGVPQAAILAASAAVLAAICVLPMLAVALAAVLGGTEILAGLAATVLPGYVVTTLTLAALVAAGTFLIGTGTAWLVTACDFPLRRVFEVALVLPLAYPAYVLAYAYTHVLDHPGIVQTALRSATGWGPRDYWFPEIRSLGGAAAMLVLVLYPYVYLLARAAFLQQGGSAFAIARTLGRGPVAAWLHVSLPMARPAIAGGVLLAVMETIADYGTVAHFGVRTFATGIYTAWFSIGDRGAAAQLALGLLGFALLLVLLERATRAGRGAYAGRSVRRPPARAALRGGAAAGAALFCAAPVVLGALLPGVILAAMAVGSGQDVLSARYMGFVRSSVTLAGVAALLTVGAAIVLGYRQRLTPGRGAALAASLARIGYAVPGGVIAVGLLVPFAAFDNALDAFLRARFEISTGLLLTGSIWLLVAAYAIRFLASALGAWEGGQATLSPNMDAAARVLGQSPLGMLRRVHLPILSPSVLTALLIVFVDVMKELPATLIMRPFGWDTLAVQAHRLASDERLGGAAVPSLMIVAVSLAPVILLVRRIGREA